MNRATLLPSGKVKLQIIDLISAREVGEVSELRKLSGGKACVLCRHVECARSLVSLSIDMMETGTYDVVLGMKACQVKYSM